MNKRAEQVVCGFTFGLMIGVLGFTVIQAAIAILAFVLALTMFERIPEQ